MAPTFEEVRDTLYVKEFAPTQEQKARFPTFDPSLAYIMGEHGAYIRKSKQSQDLVARQMLNKFASVSTLTFEEKREDLIGAANYGVQEINDYFNSSFGNITSPFALEEVPYESNLGMLLTKAREKYDNARDGKHDMFLPDGTLKSLQTAQGKPMKFFDYSSITEVFKTVQSINLGYSILRVTRSPDFEDNDKYHEDVVSWVQDLNLAPGAGFESRKKSPISTLAKMVCKGARMKDIKDLTGVRFIVESEIDARRILKNVRNRIEGNSLTEDFEKTGDRKEEENPYYDPRFECYKFVLRSGVTYPSPLKDKKIKKFIKEGGRPIPLEVQIMTEDTSRRMNDDSDQKRAHELYKYRKALTFWQIVHPWEIYAPLMIQNEEFLKSS